jgi:hypothetical protein
MPLQRSTPNYYSTGVPRNASTTAVAALDFGFPAQVLRLYNPSNVDMYANPTSTTLCTTADLCVRACSELTLTGMAISVLTLYATSTGATAQPFGVTALGG